MSPALVASFAPPVLSLHLSRVSQVISRATSRQTDTSTHRQADRVPCDWRMPRRSISLSLCLHLSDCMIGRSFSSSNAGSQGCARRGGRERVAPMHPHLCISEQRQASPMHLSRRPSLATAFEAREREKSAEAATAAVKTAFFGGSFSLSLSPSSLAFACIHFALHEALADAF